MTASAEFDERVRSFALAFLRVVQERTGGPVRREDVANFRIDGQRIALMDPQRGIRKLRQPNAALSIRTVFSMDPERRPYDDERGPDGYLRYKWRGTDADHPENIALRTDMQADLPLIWFQGIATGLSLPVAPVWFVDEEPAEH